MPEAPTGSDTSRWVSDLYIQKRDFLLGLAKDKERFALLQELIKFDPQAWDITKAFFCLDGRPHQVIGEIAKSFGLSGNSAQEQVSMVLYYIDSPYEAPNAAIRKAGNLEKKIRRQQDHVARLAEHGLTENDLPARLPAAAYEPFSLILRVWRYDRLSEYYVTPRERWLLMERYGLRSGVYRTLQSLGDEWHLTRERIRQLEDVALHRLRVLSRNIPE